MTEGGCSRGASPTIAIKSFDIPCGNGSVSGMLMTLFSVALAVAVVEVGATVEPIVESSKSSSLIISPPTSDDGGGGLGSGSDTSMASGSRETAGAVTSRTTGVGVVTKEAEPEGLVLSEKISSLSKSTEQDLVLILDFWCLSLTCAAKASTLTEAWQLSQMTNTKSS